MSNVVILLPDEIDIILTREPVAGEVDEQRLAVSVATDAVVSGRVTTQSVKGSVR